MVGNDCRRQERTPVSCGIGKAGTPAGCTLVLSPSPVCRPFLAESTKLYKVG